MINFYTKIYIYIWLKSSDYSIGIFNIISGNFWDSIWKCLFLSHVLKKYTRRRWGACRVASTVSLFFTIYFHIHDKYATLFRYNYNTLSTFMLLQLSIMKPPRITKNRSFNNCNSLRVTLMQSLIYPSLPPPSIPYYAYDETTPHPWILFHLQHCSTAPSPYSLHLYVTDRHHLPT